MPTVAVTRANAPIRTATGADVDRVPQEQQAVTRCVGQLRGLCPIHPAASALDEDVNGPETAVGRVLVGDLCNVNDIVAANLETFSPKSSTGARQPVPGP